MFRIRTLGLGFWLLQTAVVGAQHATGYSLPGRLGKAPPEKDTRPPVITVIEVVGALLNTASARGLQVVSNRSNEILLQGSVEDERAVKELRIDDQEIPLHGTATRKTFGLRLDAPPAEKVRSLKFVATDFAGNFSEKIYEITGPTASNPVPIIVMKSESQSNGGAKLSSLGRYWCLAIGVSNYDHPSLPDLTFPVIDAHEIAEVLSQFYTFDPSRVNVLRNPSRSELIAAIETYAPNGTMPLGEVDNLLVYYAGHGHWDPNYRQGYWLPRDAEKSNRANWIANSDIQSAFTAIKAKHILLISDACFAGSMLATRSAPLTTAVEEVYKLPSRKAITAGVLTEVPDESVFKKFIVKRLVENSDSYLDAGTLYTSIKAPVINNSKTRQVPQYGVIYETGDQGGEFIFVKRN